MSNDKTKVELMKIFIGNVVFSYLGLMLILLATASSFDETEILAGIAFLVVLVSINRFNYQQVLDLLRKHDEL